MGRQGRIFCIVLSVLLATGCAWTDMPEEKKVLCRIAVNDGDYACKAMDPDEERISDVSIMIFDERGDAEECLWLQNGQKTAEVSLVVGKRYSFRACANFGYRTYADHIDELDETIYYMAYPDEYSQGMPMYAEIDNIRIGEDASVELKLQRLMAKISLRLWKRPIFLWPW